MTTRVRWVGFHPDGQALAWSGDDPVFVVPLRDLAARPAVQRLEGHVGGVLSCGWRGDGRLLASAGSVDGTVRLWDMGGDPPRAEVLRAFEPNVPWLHALALSPEGRHLAAANPDGTVYVFRLAAPR
jgi:WD40 repeat protein